MTATLKDIDKTNEEREEARAALVREQTGVTDADIVSSLHTWNEIENMVSSQDQYIGIVNTTSENIQLELMQAQVRATLLQAAQLKRIADALEAEADAATRVSIKDPIAQSMLNLMKGTK